MSAQVAPTSAGESSSNTEGIGRLKGFAAGTASGLTKLCVGRECRPLAPTLY